MPPAPLTYVAIALVFTLELAAGAGPDHGSWVYGAINAMLLIYLSLKDD